MKNNEDTGQSAFEKSVETGLHEDVELRVGQPRPQKRFRWIIAVVAIILGTFLWHSFEDKITAVESEALTDEDFSSFLGLVGEKPHRGRRRFLNGKAAERIFLYVANYFD